MFKQKTTIETAFSNSAAVISVGEENSAFANLSAGLAEIRKLNGVIGYILRSNTSAIIDLVESEKIFPYAILTSEIPESCMEITQQFNLGETESVVVEGANVKVLCLCMGENKIGIFMEKNADHAKIIDRLLL